MTAGREWEAPGTDTVLRAIRGDAAALRALYEGCRPAVQRVAQSFASLDPDDVEDVVQDAFVRAFRHLAQLKDPSRLLPWLLTITRNRALTRLARAQSSAEAIAELGREAERAETGFVDPIDPEAELEIDVVRRIVEGLPDGPEKETVRLFYVEGKLSAREIAERLGVGKSAITMRLERFRAKVKRRILAEVAALRGEESKE